VADLRGWRWDGTRRVRFKLVKPQWLTHYGSRALKVDVDHQRKLSFNALADRLKKCNRRLAWVVERRSPSGRGWHRWIGVWPRPQTAVETVALQLLCGSDPHREAYLLNRALKVDSREVSHFWSARWNTFYKNSAEEIRRQNGGTEKGTRGKLGRRGGATMSSTVAKWYWMKLTQRERERIGAAKGA
jgi:hypothetical protein